VRSLATAHRVESGVFSSSTTALGFSGTIVVDGKAIQISPDDTLESISTKIALSQIQATCRVVKLAEEQYKLVITSTGLGASSRISFTDSAPASYQVEALDPMVVAAQISGTAAAGDYAIEIDSLAQAQVVQSDGFDSADSSLGFSGAFEINGISIEAQSSDSLQTLAQKINSTYSGVQAAIVQDGAQWHLRLSSLTSGAAGTIGFGDQGGVLRALGVLEGPLLVKNQVAPAEDAVYWVNGIRHTASTNSVTTIAGVSMTLESQGSTVLSVTAEGGVLKGLGVFNADDALAHETQKAQDALFVIDGYTFSRAENTISDAIPGLTISLKRTGSSSLEISDASEQLVASVKDWVAKYNDMLSSLRNYTKYDTSTKQAGALSSDRLAKDLLSQLRLQVSRHIPGLTGIRALGDIGIGFGKYGHEDQDRLVIDQELLEQKVASSREEVMSLFGAPTTSDPEPADGVAVSLFGMLETYMKPDTGFLTRHTSTIDSTITQLQKQVQSWETRLVRREAELYRQYSRMEVELTRLQGLSASIGATLDKLM